MAEQKKKPVDANRNFIEKPKAPAKKGWECPRCGVVNRPENDYCMNPKCKPKK